MLCNAHVVEEFLVCLIAFALRHQAVQLVNQFSLHLRRDTHETQSDGHTGAG